jgi:ATP-dependent protease ClpP protease subunit
MNFNTKKYNNTTPTETTETSEEEISYNIITKGNEIYFYEDIEKEQILQLISNIKDLSYTLRLESIKYGFQPVIHLHLYSNGGDAFMGLSAYDFIRNSEIPIYTYIDGMIASAATFIYLAGHMRYMTENGTILIHQISTNFWGKFEDLKDECQNTTELMKIVKRIYSNHTNMKKKHLEQLLKRELLLPYSECVKYGIVYY